MKYIRKGREADVGLLLEGTFPYVSGGVSSWVNQIIRGFPDITFAICFLGSCSEDYGDMRYELPDNVVHLEVHYLHDKRPAPAVAARSGNRKAFADVRKMHEQLREPRQSCPAESIMPGIIEHMRGGRLSESDFLHSRESWDYISEQYQERCTDPSFVDYFWTVRTMHTPIWMLMKIMEKFIPCRSYHTVSTGYAGLLGALLKQHTGRSLILSEHGIYTKERKIDLFQAQWISDNRNSLERNPTDIAYFRHLWVRFFEAIGRECYRNADQIVALYEANRQRQIADGAPEEKTFCVPNGINLAGLEKALKQRTPEIPQVVCLIGRVVPIKDIKTFIRAMRGVADRLPRVQAWIAGPEDEDPAYAEECRALAESLGLTNHVKMLGFQKVDQLLPKVGVMVLSSISEALPLVILEGFAAGVPCVATDVGSCRQLIEGGGEEDRRIGSAGAVVGIANPEALADAVSGLLENPDRWQEAQRAGLERVRRYYTQDQMLSRYRKVYERGFALTDAIDDGEKASLWRRLWQA